MEIVFIIYYIGLSITGLICGLYKISIFETFILAVFWPLVVLNLLTLKILKK